MRSCGFFAGILFLLALGACSEIGPVITPLDPGNAGGTNIPRRVLLEDFGGVRCVGCPAGYAEIAALQQAFGKDRLIAISVHAGSFSPPYPESIQDFRTPEGPLLLDLIGRPLGYPAGTINRRIFANEPRRVLSPPQWAGYIQQELQIPPLVEVRLQPNYQGSSRTLNLTVTVGAMAAATGLPTDLRLSVAITENNIVDYQLTPDGRKPDYLHQHVLRTMLTPYDGTPLTEPLIPGGLPLTRRFSFILPPAWVAANCQIIAFVHQGGNNSLEVLQVNDVSLAP